MTRGLVLSLADVSKPFEVLMDASDFVLGGVLFEERHRIDEARSSIMRKGNTLSQEKKCLSSSIALDL